MIRDWLNHPPEHGAWGMRVNGWMGELVKYVRGQADDIAALDARLVPVEDRQVLRGVDVSFTDTTAPGHLVGTLTVPEDGEYLIEASCFIEYSIAADYFVTFIARGTGGVGNYGFGRTTIAGTGTRYQSIAFRGYEALTAGDDVTLYIYRNNAAGTVIAKNLDMVVSRVV